MPSFIIGKRVTSNLFAKLIGSSLDKSYFFFMMFVIAVTRTCAPFVNIELLKSYGLRMVFGVSGLLYILSILLMTFFIDALSPHYSYLIEKQKELLAKGISNKDLKLLETPEYGGLPMPQNYYNKITNRMH